MTEQKTPLETLIERIRQLLDGRAPAAVGDEIQHAIERFFEAFQLVPRREFEVHMQALRDLQALVAGLESRVGNLEAARD